MSLTKKINSINLKTKWQFFKRIITLLFFAKFDSESRVGIVATDSFFLIGETFSWFAVRSVGSVKQSASGSSTVKIYVLFF